MLDTMTNLNDQDAQAIEDAILHPETTTATAEKPNPFAPGSGTGFNPNLPGNSVYGSRPTQVYGDGRFGAPSPYGSFPPGVGMNPGTENLWAIFAHLGGVFLTWLVPLIVYLAFRDKSAFITDHAKEALNFQITLFLGYVISGFLAMIIIGVFTAMALGILSVIFAIMGAVAASHHQGYRYPLNIRFIK